MKTVAFGILIYLVWFTPMESPNTENPGFTLIKKDEAMELSERWITMEDGTESREVKFISRIHAPLDTVLKVLRNEQIGILWNSHALDFRIKETGENSWISYIRYRFPFPLSARECYLSNKLISEPGGETIYFRSYESGMFSNGDPLEQMKGLEGKWVLAPKGNFTELVYHIVSVPDNSLPRWLVDPIIRKNLWSSMEKLSAIIEQK